MLNKVYALLFVCCLILGIHLGCNQNVDVLQKCFASNAIAIVQVET